MRDIDVVRLLSAFGTADPENPGKRWLCLLQFSVSPSR
jgi:hypothetical protein